MALLICGSLFVINDLKNFKVNIVNNLNVLAGAVGQNIRAALYFRDGNTARKVLSSLKEESQIQYAALYDSNNEVFVTYYKDGDESLKPQDLENTQPSFYFENFEVRRSIFLKNKIIGEIYLYATNQKFKEHIENYILIVAFIFIFTLVLAFILSIQLQRIVSNPILTLSNIAKQISQNKDYSLRGDHISHDELGTLYEGFNNMLEQIQKRDLQLEEYKSDLEKRVHDRTNELSRANTELKRSLEEKEILLKEIHHRVKNNLQIVSSLINLQNLNCDNPKVSPVFEESAGRIRSIALLHEKFYQSKNLKKISFQGYLKELVFELAQTYGFDKNKIAININTNNIALDIDQGIPCGLIVHELVTNSLKYAFLNGKKGQIDISLSNLEEKDGILNLVVRDNGEASNINFNFDNPKTLGLLIVNTLVKNQLKGQIEYKQENGTEINIVFSKGV